MKVIIKSVPLDHEALYCFLLQQSSLVFVNEWRVWPKHIGPLLSHCLTVCNWQVTLLLKQGLFSTPHVQKTEGQLVHPEQHCLASLEGDAESASRTLAVAHYRMENWPIHEEAIGQKTRPAMHQSWDSPPTSENWDMGWSVSSSKTLKYFPDIFGRQVNGPLTACCDPPVDAACCFDSLQGQAWTIQSSNTPARESVEETFQLSRVRLHHMQIYLLLILQIVWEAPNLDRI